MLRRFFHRFFKIKPSRISAFVLYVRPDGMVCTVTARPSKIANGRATVGLPGGKVDYGESPEQAALRECQEEGWSLKSPTVDKLKLVHSDIVNGKLVNWYQWTGEEPEALYSYKERSEIFPVLIHHKTLAFPVVSHKQKKTISIERDKK